MGGRLHRLSATPAAASDAADAAAEAAGVAYELSESSGSTVLNVSLSAAAVARASAAAAAAGSAAVTLTIVSESLGIDKFSSINNGPTPASFSTSAIKGITSTKAGSVVYGGADITANGWTMVVGLAGELKQVRGVRALKEGARVARVWLAR